MAVQTYSLQNYIDEVIFEEPWRFEKIDYVISRGIERAADLIGESAKHIYIEFVNIEGLEMKAFLESDGDSLEYESNGLFIQVANARRLPISAEFIDPGDPNINDEQYRTCRNWQFAHYAAKHFVEGRKES